MNMTIEDIKEYRKNAVDILERNTQYATARAVEEAFDALLYLNEVVDKFNAYQDGYPVSTKNLRFALRLSEIIKSDT